MNSTLTVLPNPSRRVVFGSVALVGGTMITALTVYVDAWWHVTFGRDSFWTPPHIAIYTGIAISVAGFISVYALGKRIPRELTLYLAGLAGVLSAGYGDQLWHQRFGVEKIGTLAAIWSPTHVAALVAGAVTATGIILYLHSTMKMGGYSVLGWLIAGEFAVLISILTLIVLPLGPETPFRIIGISGAPLVAFMVLYLRFTGSLLSTKPGTLTLITAFNWTGNTIILSTYASQNVVTLLLSAGIAPAVLADMIIHRSEGLPLNKLNRYYALAGLTWGIIFGCIFYPLTNGLINTPLDLTSLVLIALSSSVAGLASGILAWSQSAPIPNERAQLYAQASLEAASEL